jgi:GDP-4-dehydro-6-deoxy-D-mannose reductase
LLRALITGVGGFAGSHLADVLLARREAEIWGCVIDEGRPDYLDPQVQLIQADLRDPQAVMGLLQRVRPDRVYHLAGQSFPQQSWADPWDTFETNLRPQINLFEAMLRLDLRPRVLIVGSSEVYGQMPLDEAPVPETAPLRPRNPYAVSKAAQDLVGLQYFLSHRLPVVRVRPSNHIGPRQNERFVAPAFARQLALIEAGRQPPVLRVGNLSAQRDFTDVRDVARAYWLALEKGEPGEAYNVGTGRVVPVQAILDGLLALTTAQVRVEVDPALLRPADTPIRRGDPAKLRAWTGWQAEIPLEQTFRDLLDYERSRVGERLQTGSV